MLARETDYLPPAPDILGSAEVEGGSLDHTWIHSAMSLCCGFVGKKESDATLGLETMLWSLHNDP